MAKRKKKVRRGGSRGAARPRAGGASSGVAAEPAGRRSGLAAAREAFLAGPSVRRVAEERQALRDRVAKDRAQRYADYLRQVAEPTEPPGSEKRTAALAAPQRQLRILAEGDSWFEYPLPVRFPQPSGDGVIYQLQKLLGYPILNMAHHGAEVRQMLALQQRQEIIARLSDPNVKFDAMLFSGGGNDLVGDQFCIWLRDVPPAAAPQDMFNEPALASALDMLEAEYRELVRIRDVYSPQTWLFVHGYDFPPITGIGVCGVGPWLKPSLDYQYRQLGVPNPDPAQEFLVVRALLQQFNAMLLKIAADSANVARFVVVPTQGTLQANDTDWQNEIHPSPGGFTKIAQKFKEALDQAFPITS